MTPETESETFCAGPDGARVVDAAFARKLETQRDELAAALREIIRGEGTKSRYNIHHARKTARAVLTKVFERHICPTCDAGDPTNVITSCDCK